MKRASRMVELRSLHRLLTELHEELMKRTPWEYMGQQAKGLRKTIEIVSRLRSHDDVRD